MTEPRILLWDIESAPNRAFTWAKWQQDVIAFEKEWYLLSIAWRWLGDKKTQVLALPDFELYDTDPEDDYALVSHAWDLFDSADIVVAHNGVAFDTKKAQARMIIHGFDPPSSFKEVDTLQLARRHFAFTSNRLGDVCEVLGIGSKAATGGFGTWRGCMAGDPKAWATMKKYNRQDVDILEELYLRLRPWSKTHPNLATMSDRSDICPKCGSEAGMVVHGYTYTAVTRRARYKCRSCGGTVSSRTIEKTSAKYVAS